jgi:hypothetical protein
MSKFCWIALSFVLVLSGCKGCDAPHSDTGTTHAKQEVKVYKMSDGSKAFEDDGIWYWYVLSTNQWTQSPLNPLSRPGISIVGEEEEEVAVSEQSGRTSVVEEEEEAPSSTAEEEPTETVPTETEPAEATPAETEPESSDPGGDPE